MIAIIGILAAILIPVVGKVRENGRAAVCSSNLRQIGQGIAMYALEHNGEGPMGRNTSNYPGSTMTFHYSIWTYVGYETAEFGNPKNFAQTTSIADNIFLCPTTRSVGPTYGPRASGVTGVSYTYALNVLPAPAAESRLQIDTLESPSQTASVVEMSDWWAVPRKWYIETGLIPHGGSSNVLFYDGHVERLSYAQFPTPAESETSVFWSGSE